MKKTILLALVLSVATMGAQNTEIGLMGGVSLYSGDLSPTEFGIYFEELNPAFGLFGKRNFNGTFSLRLAVSYGKLSGDDANRKDSERNLNFRSDILELALTAEVNLFRIGNGTIIPYHFGGVGVFHFNPEAILENNYVELQPLGTEGQGLPGYEEPYKLSQINFPMGAGIKVMLNESLSLGFEFGGRKLSTDYLDDLSDKTVNYLDVFNGNGELAARLSNPGIKDPEDVDYVRGGSFNDWYYIGNVSLSFVLSGERSNGKGKVGRRSSGKTLGCPKF